jgi:hypothetical protein
MKQYSRFTASDFVHFASVSVRKLRQRPQAGVQILCDGFLRGLPLDFFHARKEPE